VAYETGSASDVADLVNKLFTFATGLTTKPWVQDELSTLQGTLHLDDCYVTFKWSNNPGEEHALGVFNSTGYSSSTPADDMPGDSGCGDASNIDYYQERHVNFTDGEGNDNAGPFNAYHFFAGEGDNPYVYAVVESVAGVYRHFGFGNLEKTGDWTGGEFAYAHYWGAYEDEPWRDRHAVMLDATENNRPDKAASMRVEGLPGQDPTSKWGVFIDSYYANDAGDDTAGNPRVPLAGTARTGGLTHYLGWIRASKNGAYVPLIPIIAFYRDREPTPEEWMWLGQMPGVFVVNIANFSPGDEFTRGGDTYKVFPLVRKQYLNSNTEETRHAGVAYLKVT
jgi:hypothetical protein